MIFFQIHDSQRLLITNAFNDVLIGYLRYGKTANKKRKIFATWLQKELNSDVARFTTHENKPYNLISCKTGSNIGGKTRNITIQLCLKQCCKTSCTFFFKCCPFYCSFCLVLCSFFGVQTSVLIQNCVDFEPLFLGIIIHFIQVWRFLFTFEIIPPPPPALNS